jgi:hypothetical protein
MCVRVIATAVVVSFASRGIRCCLYHYVAMFHMKNTIMEGKKRGAKIKTIDAAMQNDLQQIGAALRRLRKDAGYSSHEAFAFDHNIARAQYLAYEHGRNMQLSTLITILRCHGLTLGEFFAMVEEKN